LKTSREVFIYYLENEDFRKTEVRYSVV